MSCQTNVYTKSKCKRCAQTIGMIAHIVIRGYAVVATTDTYGNVFAQNTASWGDEAPYCGLPCVVDSGHWSDGTCEVRLSARAQKKR